MPRISQANLTDVPIYIGGEVAGVSRFNMALNFGISMPQNGWVTDIALRGAMEAGASARDHRLVLYIGSPREFLGALQTWNQTMQTYTQAIPGGVRVFANASVRWGVFRTGGYDALNQTTIQTTPNAASRGPIHYYDTAGAPSTLPGTADYSTQNYWLTGYVDYVEQVAPTTGAWQNPTPAQGAEVADNKPTFRGSTPHGNGDGAYDETNLVELEITENPVSGSTTTQTFSIVPTSAEKSGNYFERAPKTFAIGSTVTARFRHRDSWNALSGWSATRTFTILDAPPGQGSWQSPTPAQGSVVSTSTPTFRGSTPHNNGDGAYDQSTRVHLVVEDRTTNATLFDQARNTTAAEKSGKYFEWTPLNLSGGTKVRARFWHADTNNNWSAESATRSFDISPGPDPPGMTRPSGKIDYIKDSSV